jgi:hypothetical protein
MIRIGADADLRPVVWESILRRKLWARLEGAALYGASKAN